MKAFMGLLMRGSEVLSTELLWEVCPSATSPSPAEHSKLSGQEEYALINAAILEPCTSALSVAALNLAYLSLKLFFKYPILPRLITKYRIVPNVNWYFFYEKVCSKRKKWREELMWDQIGFQNNLCLMIWAAVRLVHVRTARFIRLHLESCDSLFPCYGEAAQLFIFVQQVPTRAPKGSQLLLDCNLRPAAEKKGKIFQHSVLQKDVTKL